MTTLAQSIAFKSNYESFEERISLSPGETEQTRFQPWLVEMAQKPRPYCPNHPHTQLVLDSTGNEIRQAFKDDDNKMRRCYGLSEIERGVFHFKAAMRCPACCCAYALCPPEFHQTSFETYDTSTPQRASALAICREFAAQVNQRGCGWFLVVGGPGIGKTRLSCNMIGALENRDALYVRQGQLTNALRATYGSSEELEYDYEKGEWGKPKHPLKITQAVRCLVLDEIGCVGLANDERLLLDELLKYRYEQRKPTILISNLALDQLKEFLGDANYDRIRHATGGGKFILQLSGESFRRTSGETYLEGLT